VIVALLIQKGGIGKTTLALHLAGHSARQGKRVRVIDADPQGSALDCSEQRAQRRFERLFGVIGQARETLYREAPVLARHADHVVIDGPPRIAALLRSALLAADAVLVPAQLSPFDGLGSAEMLALISEARVFRPALVARFVLNRCAARTIIARDTTLNLADHDPPALAARIAQRVIFADAARVAASHPDHATRSFGSKTLIPASPRRRRAISTRRGSPSTSRRRSAAASRSRPSSAAKRSPICCAPCSRANSPTPMEASHEA
jgi:chromosome partitioning protein